MNEPTSIRGLIRAQLAEGAATREELLEALDAIDDPRQLAQALHTMKHAGQIDRDADGRYRLIGTAPKGAPRKRPGPRSEHSAPSKPTAPAAPAAQETADAGCATFVQQADTAPVLLSGDDVLAGEPATADGKREPTLRDDLAGAARRSEEALHRYIGSLDDPVLESLMEAAGWHREALDAYDQRGGAA